MAIIESVLTLLIVGLIGGTGYYVWHTKQQTDKTLDASQSISSNPKRTQISKVTTYGSTQTYTNTRYGFSFQYPNTWKLTTNFGDLGRGGPEGDISVLSPSGTKVHFDPNFGGKGGDCIDNQANDAHTTRTCTTRNILSVDKLASSGSQDIYLLKGSDTEPTSDGGKISYFVYLDSGYGVPNVGSTLGVFLGPYDDVIIKHAAGEFVYLTVYIEGKDDAQNSSATYLESNEVKEAVPVLQSLHIM